jgi:hypothetical protein
LLHLVVFVSANCHLPSVCTDEVDEVVRRV